MSITWSQALAFRMRRHLLEPVGTESVVREVSPTQETFVPFEFSTMEMSAG